MTPIHSSMTPICHALPDLHRLLHAPHIFSCFPYFSLFPRFNLYRRLTLLHQIYTQRKSYIAQQFLVSLAKRPHSVPHVFLYLRTHILFDPFSSYLEKLCCFLPGGNRRGDLGHTL